MNNLLFGQYSILWFTIFVGGIIVYIRASEKTFRDKLENFRERYQQIKDDSRVTELARSAARETVVHSTYVLEGLSAPTQKELYRCAQLVIFILTVQVILISFEGVIFQQEKQIQSLVYKALVFVFYILNIKLYISAFLTVRRWHSIVTHITEYYQESYQEHQLKQILKGVKKKDDG